MAHKDRNLLEMAPNHSKMASIEKWRPLKMALIQKRRQKQKTSAHNRNKYFMT